MGIKQSGGAERASTHMGEFYRKLRGDARGASAIEYGLILSLVVLAIMAAVSGVAGETLKMWNHVEVEAGKAHGTN
jgi:pilus assembly protein Flp/PilA